MAKINTLRGARKKKYDFLIFGAGGMQGKIVIKDLLEKGYKIFVSDIYQSHLDELEEKFSKVNFSNKFIFIIIAFFFLNFSKFIYNKINRMMT